MKNVSLLIGTLVGTAILVFSVVWLFSRPSSSSQNLSPEVKDQLVSENPHTKGPADAAVTIVEFSDFQCPACRSALPAVEAVTSAYPQQVRVVYRNFPLNSIHPNAQLAAQAAESVAELGGNEAFWAYHDILFENQSTWSQLDSKDDLKNTLADYAAQLTIDKPSFLEKIESDHIKSLITEDVQLGGQVGIKGTPTFFVNGQVTSAPQLMSSVESIINN